MLQDICNFNIKASYDMSQTNVIYKTESWNPSSYEMCCVFKIHKRGQIKLRLNGPSSWRKWGTFIHHEESNFNVWKGQECLMFRYTKHLKKIYMTSVLSVQLLLRQSLGLHCTWSLDIACYGWCTDSCDSSVTMFFVLIMY